MGQRTSQRGENNNDLMRSAPCCTVDQVSWWAATVSLGLTGLAVYFYFQLASEADVTRKEIHSVLEALSQSGLTANLEWYLSYNPYNSTFRRRSSRTPISPIRMAKRPARAKSSGISLEYYVDLFASGKAVQKYYSYPREGFSVVHFDPSDCQKSNVGSISKKRFAPDNKYTTSSESANQHGKIPPAPWVNPIELMPMHVKDPSESFVNRSTDIIWNNSRSDLLSNIQSFLKINGARFLFGPYREQDKNLRCTFDFCDIAVESTTDNGPGKVVPEVQHFTTSDFYFTLTKFYYVDRENGTLFNVIDATHFHELGTDRVTVFPRDAATTLSHETTTSNLNRFIPVAAVGSRGPQNRTASVPDCDSNSRTQMCPESLAQSSALRRVENFVYYLYRYLYKSQSCSLSIEPDLRQIIMPSTIGHPATAALLTPRRRCAKHVLLPRANKLAVGSFNGIKTGISNFRTKKWDSVESESPTGWSPNGSESSSSSGSVRSQFHDQQSSSLWSTSGSPKRQLEFTRATSPPTFFPPAPLVEHITETDTNEAGATTSVGSARLEDNFATWGFHVIKASSALAGVKAPWYALETKSIPPVPRVAVLSTHCPKRDPYGPPMPLVFQYRAPSVEICYNGIAEHASGYVDDCFGYDFTGWHRGETFQVADPRRPGLSAQDIESEAAVVATLCPTCEVLCLKIGQDNRVVVGDAAQALHYATKVEADIIVYNAIGPWTVNFQAAIEFATSISLLVTNAVANLSTTLGDTQESFEMSSCDCSEENWTPLFMDSTFLSVAPVNEDLEIPVDWGTRCVNATLAAPAYLVKPQAGFNRPLKATALVAGTIARIMSLLPPGINKPRDVATQLVFKSCSRTAANLPLNGRVDCMGVIDYEAAVTFALEFNNAIQTDKIITPTVSDDESELMCLQSAASSHISFMTRRTNRTDKTEAICPWKASGGRDKGVPREKNFSI